MSKILIAFFSHAGQNYVNGDIVNLPIGNTAIVANKLLALTGGELYHIEQVEPYPEDYHQLTEFAKRELRANARPDLKGPIPVISDYNILLLGYPNWWGTMPMPVWTFLESAPTTSLKIAPFCTNEGSGMGRSEKDLARLCPEAEILRGLAITGHNAANSEAALTLWVKDLGLSKK